MPWPSGLKASVYFTLFIHARSVVRAFTSSILILV